MASSTRWTTFSKWWKPIIDSANVRPPGASRTCARNGSAPCGASLCGKPSPTIIALGQRLEQIRSAELERYRNKLGTLEAAQRRAVEALTRGILNKMLHGPVHEPEAHAGEPEQDVRLQLVRRIFGLA